MKAATFVLEFGNHKVHMNLEYVTASMFNAIYAELQQDGSDEEEWVLSQAADLTSYRNLNVTEVDMRMLKAQTSGLWYIVISNCSFD